MRDGERKRRADRAQRHPGNAEDDHAPGRRTLAGSLAPRARGPSDGSTTPSPGPTDAARALQDEPGEELPAVQPGGLGEAFAAYPLVARRAKTARQAAVAQRYPALAEALDGAKAPSIDDAATAAVENKASGAAVNAQVAAQVGSHLGADFGDVRVHQDPLAQEATQAMGARAFAHGSDVFLGPGESGSDLGLMAHELTHVAQQGAAGQRTPQRRVLVGDANTPAEQEADQVAAAVTAGSGRPAQLLVDEGPVQPGQMQKDQFLAQLEPLVTAAADAELGPMLSAVGCPYIAEYFRRYATRPATEGEAVLRRFAPATRTARTAQDMIEPVLARVREGVRHWRATGQPPPDIAAAEPAAAAALAPAAQALRAPDGRETLASLEADLGPGEALDGATAARMSGALGTSLGEVRVHTGAVAARKAADAGAMAFAVGPNVVLGADAPAAGTLAGDALLAHELVHTVQQRGAAGSAEAQRAPIGGESAEAEEHADAAAVAAVAELHGDEKPGLLARLGGAARKLAGSIADVFTSEVRLQRCDPTDERVRHAGVVHGNAVDQTGEQFQEGNVPGERPAARLTGGGWTEIRFDGDGDQMKEMSCRLRVSARWPDGSARTLHVAMTQLSSSQEQSADYQLPEGSRDPMPIFSQATDGRAPTLLDLMGAHLQIWPPDQVSPTQTQYRGDLVAAGDRALSSQGAVANQTHLFSFAREATPLRDVFDADAATTIGGIWSTDLSIGAYRDRFRLTLQQPAGSSRIHMGMSVLDGRTGEATGGERVDLHAIGPFRPQVIDVDPVRFGIDLDGDGTSDLDFFDRMIEPQEVDGGHGHPEQTRNHTITAIGRGLPQGHEFSYQVRDRMISAGSTAPDAEDRQAASNATAVSGLEHGSRIGVADLTREEQRGTLQGEIDMLDNVLVRARHQASLTNPPLISPEMFEAWDALSRDFTVIEAQRAGTGVTTAQRDAAATHAEAYWRLFRAAVASHDVTHSRRRVSVTNNEFSNFGGGIARYLRRGQYQQAFSSYRDACDGLDRWIAHQHAETHIAMAGSDENAVLGQIGQVAALRGNLEEARRHNPTRVSAVYHPAEPYEETGRVTEVPLSLYLWKEGGTFHLHDLTSDDAPHETLDSTAEQVPAAIFAQLAESDHYPRGTIHYQVPGGVGGQQATNGPPAWREALSWIGLGLGVVGLGLATFATGGLATLGTVALAGSAIAGGVLAGDDLVERFRHGNLTPATAIVDVAQIVAAIAGLGALRSAGVVNAARQAAADGVPLTATAALAAQWHSRAAVALSATGAGADVVQLAVFLPESIAQYDAIDGSGADDETKRRQRLILLSQLAMTSGLTVLSVRGSMGEFTPGRGIAITYERGVAIAVPEGMSLPGRAIRSSRPAIDGAVDEASFLAAEQRHLGTIRSQVDGPAGETLASIDDLAQRTAWRTEEARRIMEPIGEGATASSGGPITREVHDAVQALGRDVDAILANPASTVGERRAAVRERIQRFHDAHPGLTGIDYTAALARASAVGVEGVDGVLLLDATGQLTRDGAAAGTLDDLVLRVNQANNASRAHGLRTEYSLRVTPQGEGQPQRVEVTSSERGAPLSPAAATPLYTQAAARSEAQLAQIARVRQHAPDAVVELLPEGVVRINNQIDLQPAFLAEISDDDLVRIALTSAALERTGGNISQLRGAERTAFTSLTGSQGLRLRFRAQYGAQLDSWLVAMQLDQSPQLRALLANATDTDRIRLWDLYNESKRTLDSADIVNPRMRRQAADYALARNPESIYEFVEHYQFYEIQFKARVDADRLEYERLIEAARTGPPPRSAPEAQRVASLQHYEHAYNAAGFADARLRKVLDGLSGDGDPNTTSAATRAEVGARYEHNVAALEGHLAARGIPPGQDAGAARTAIQRLPEVPFASESSGAYHAAKHASKLPPSERTGNDVADYLAAVNRTIHAPASAETDASQLGLGRTHSFTRIVDVPGATAGSTSRYTLTAIVAEGPDGNVSVATLLIERGTP
jgi:hypothetical protein